MNENTDSVLPARPVRVKRDGIIVYGATRCGRVIREVDGWSPAELNGDYLGMTVYRRRSDAVTVVTDWYRRYGWHAAAQNDNSGASQ